MKIPSYRYFAGLIAGALLFNNIAQSIYITHAVNDKIISFETEEDRDNIATASTIKKNQEDKEETKETKEKVATASEIKERVDGEFVFSGLSTEGNLKAGKTINLLKNVKAKYKNNKADVQIVDVQAVGLGEDMPEFEYEEGMTHIYDTEKDVEYIVTYQATYYDEDEDEEYVGEAKKKFVTKESTFSEMSDYGEEIKHLNDMDFSSKRLMIECDNESELTWDTEILSHYGDVYLVQFNDAKETKNAYVYYSEHEYIVAPDNGLEVSEKEDTEENIEEENTEEDEFESIDIEPVITDTVMTEDENPFSMADMLKTSNVTTKRGGHTIALIDTGASTGKNVYKAVTMIGKNAADKHGHGTDMVNTIVSEDPNANILSIKAVDDNGKANASAVYSAIQYAINENVDIINLSVAGYTVTENEILTNIIRKAVNAGIIVVGAAGNYGYNVRYFMPGVVEETLIVGAVDSDGNRVEGTNYGDTIDYGFVADSTSEAAAKMSGWLSKNVSDLSDYQAALESAVNNGKIFEMPSETAEDNVTRRIIYDANGGTFDNNVTIKSFKVPMVYIAKTSNVDENGFNTEGYNDKETDIQQVIIPNVKKLNVRMLYSTQTDYDWVSVYENAVKGPTVNQLRSMDDAYKVSGGEKKYKKDTFHKDFTIDGDSVTFYFHSNEDKNDYYGYYARVSDASANFKFPEVTNGNKILVAWNTKADGTGERYYFEDDPAIKDGTTLYAEWAKNETGILLDANGGKFENGQATNTTTTNYKSISYVDQYKSAGYLGRSQSLTNTYTLDNVDNILADVSIKESKAEEITVKDKNKNEIKKYTYQNNDVKETLDITGNQIIFDITYISGETIKGYTADLYDADFKEPIRNGYIFKGWNVDSNSTIGLSRKEIIENKDSITILYAIWEKADNNAHIVYLNANEGSVEGKDFITTVAKNNSKFPTATRDGYKFVEWNSDRYGTGTTYKTMNDIPENQTAYAIWEISSLKVLLNANGGSFNGEEEKELLFDVSLDNTEAIVHTSNIDDNGNKVSELLKTETKNYQYKGADGLFVDLYYSIGADKYYTNTTPYLNIYEVYNKNGYDFSSKLNTEITCLGDFVYPTNYKDATHKQIYINSDTVKLTTYSYKKDSTGTGYYGFYAKIRPYHKVQNNMELPVPTRDGYTFIYWATDKSGDGERYTDIKDLPLEKTLYAVWKKDEINIKLNSNGGYFSNNETIKEYKVNKYYEELETSYYHLNNMDDNGNIIQSRVNAVDSGYRNSSYNTIYIPEADCIKIDVLWNTGTSEDFIIKYTNANNSETIFINDNSSSYNKISDGIYHYYKIIPNNAFKYESYYYKDDRSYGYYLKVTGLKNKIKINEEIEYPTFKDYSLKSWNTKPDGSGDSYDVNLSGLNVEGNIELYAQYGNLNDDYTLLNANGGHFKDGSETTKFEAKAQILENKNWGEISSSYSYASSGYYLFELDTNPVNIIIDSNYNGSTVLESKRLLPGIYTTDQSKNTNLYPSSFGNVTLINGDYKNGKYHLSSATNVKSSISNSKNLYIGANSPFKAYAYSTDITLNDKTPVREGYKFLGWCTSKDGYGLYINYPFNGHELYAQWEKTPSSVIFDANGGSFNNNVKTKSFSIHQQLIKTIGVKDNGEIGDKNNYKYIFENNFAYMPNVSSVFISNKLFNNTTSIINDNELKWARLGYDESGSQLKSNSCSTYSNSKWPIKIVASNEDENNKEQHAYIVITAYQSTNFDISGLSNGKKVFAEWNTEPDGSGLSYPSNINNFSTYQDYFIQGKTLYAIWKEPGTVKFDYNGGKLNNEEYHYYDISSGYKTLNKIPIPSAPISGFSFKCWGINKNGQIIELENYNYQIDYSGDTEYIAIWNNGPGSYNWVKLYANGGKFSDGSEIKEISYYRTNNTDIGQYYLPTLNDKIPVLWNTKPDGSGTSYAFSGYDIPISSNRYELYAIYDSDNEIKKITLHGNGGTINNNKDYILNVPNVRSVIAKDTTFVVSDFIQYDGPVNIKVIDKTESLISLYHTNEKNVRNSLSLSLKKDSKDNLYKGSYHFDQLRYIYFSTLRGTLYIAPDFTVEDTSIKNGNKTFYGWNTKSDGSGIYIDPMAYNDFAKNAEYLVDLTNINELYAIWDKGIIFDANGGRYNDKATEKYYKYQYLNTITDETVTKPTREHYKFKGWSITKNGEVLESINTLFNTGKTETTKLYAQWERIDIPVILYGNGGLFNNINEKQIVYINKNNNLKNIEINLPIKTGYQILNWNTKVDGTGTTVDLFNISELTEYMELYAQWQITTYHRFFYDTQGGHCDIEHKDYAESTVIPKLPSATRLGYIFKGWKAKERDFIFETGKEWPKEYYKDNILEAQWEVINYPIKYDLDGGEVHYSKNNRYELWYFRKYHDFYTVEDEFSWGWAIMHYNFSVPGGFGQTSYDYNASNINPEKEGYKFIGWTGSNGEIPEAYVPIPKGSTRPLEFKANWEINEYTITYNYNETLDTFVGERTKKYLHGDKIGTLPTIERPNYIFKNWTTSGISTVDENTQVKNNYIITPVFEGVPVDVIYDLNYENAPEYTKRTVKYGDTYYIDDTSYVKHPEREEWYFDGWYTEKEGGVKYTSSIKMTSAEPITYYAHWIKKIKVTFDYNDGVTPNTYVLVNPGSSVSMPSDPKRNGYKFAKWYEGDTPYKSRNLYIDITLTAHWDKAYTVTYVVNGETVHTEQCYENNNLAYNTNGQCTYIYSNTGTFNDSSNSNKRVTKTWYSDAKYTSTQIKYNYYIMPSEDITLYGKTVNSYYLKVHYPWTNTTSTYTAMWVDENDHLLSYITPYNSNVLNTTGVKDILGWYTEPEYKNKVTDQTLVTEKTLDVYPKVEKRVYKIYLDSNGGDAVSPSEYSISLYDTLPKFPTPTRKGHTFRYWYSNYSGTYNYNTAQTFTAGRDLVYSAYWQANTSGSGETVSSTNVTFTFKCNSGYIMTPSGGTTNSSFTVSVPKGSYYNINTRRATETTKRFDGWKLNGTIVSGNILADSNKTFEAQWTNKYKLTMYEKNNTIYKYLLANETFKIPSVQYVVPGTKLTNWKECSSNKSIASNAKSYKVGDTFTMGTSDQYLIAQYENTTCKVTLDPNGGTYQGKTTPYTTTWTNNVSNSFPTPAPTKPGYRFDGWTNGSITTSGSYTPKDNEMYWKAVWNEISYSLYLYDDSYPNGSISYTITKDSKLDMLPKTMERNGYKFKGWYTAKSGGTKYTQDSVMPDSSLYLYTQWEADTTGEYTKYITVTYNSNGGNIGTVTKQFKIGEGIIFPETSKSYYKLVGWYTEKDGGNRVIEGTKAGKSDITLYAHWEAQDYIIDVNYEVNDESQYFHTFEDISAKFSIYVNDKLVAKDFTQAINFKIPYNAKYKVVITENDPYIVPDKKELTGTMPGQNTEVYFRFYGSAYNVAFDLNGVEGTAPSTISSKHGKYISMPDIDVEKEGYEFVGWTLNKIPETSERYYQPYEFVKNLATTGTVTFYAQWKPIHYTVKFNMNGGQGKVEPMSAVYDVEFELPDPTKQKNVPYKPGNTISGWNTKPGLTGQHFEFKEKVSNLTSFKDGVVTLFAEWDPEMYTVTFNIPDDVDYDGQETYEYPYNAKVVLPELERNNEVVKYWTYVSDAIDYNQFENIWTEDNRVTGNIILTPIFEVSTGTIIYDENYFGGSDIKVEVPVGKKVNPQDNKITRIGYKLLGWYSEMDGGTLEESFIMTKQTKTVYAQWQEVKYTVTYNIPEDVTSDAEDQIYQAYEPIKLPSTAEKEGYVHIGWEATNSKGEKFIITQNYEVTDDLVVEPIFELDLPKGNIVYHTVYDNGIDIYSGFVDTVINVNEPSAGKPVREGYTLVGWYTAAENGELVTEVTIQEEDIDVYAVWKINYYDVTYIDIPEDGEFKGQLTQTYAYGSTVDEVATLKRPHFEFDHWEYTINGTTWKVFEKGYVVKANTRVRPVYTSLVRLDSDVIYDSNHNGVELMFKTYTVGYKLNTNSVAPIEKTGYNFTGWYTKPEGGEKVDELTIAYEDVRLYAHWEIKKFTVKYKDIPEDAVFEGPAEKVYEYGDAIHHPSITRPHYVFKYWYRQIPGTLDYAEIPESHIVDSNLIVYPQFEEITYKVNYHTGNNLDTKTVSHREASIVNTEEYKPTMGGFKFVGWYDAEEGGNLVTTFEMPSHDTDLYGRWEIRKYTIDYIEIPSDAELNGDAHQEYKYQDPYSLLTIVRDNDMYTYKGWEASRDHFNDDIFTPKNGTLIEDDIEIRPIFEKNKSIVTYDENYVDDIVYGAKNQVKYTIGDTIKTADYPEVRRPGHEFIGWFDEAEGGNLVEEFTVPEDDNLVLYAHWKIDTYFVRYIHIEETDTLVGNFDDELSGDKVQYYEYKQLLQTPTLTREGKTFLGWEDYEGNPWKTGDMVRGDLELHPRFLEDNVHLTYDPNYQDAPDDQYYTLEVQKGTVLSTKNQVPFREGYEFLGWYYTPAETDEEDTKISVEEITMLKDVIVYARWAKITDLPSTGGLGTKPYQIAALLFVLILGIGNYAVYRRKH